MRSDQVEDDFETPRPANPEDIENATNRPRSEIPIRRRLRFTRPRQSRICSRTGRESAGARAPVKGRSEEYRKDEIS